MCKGIYRTAMRKKSLILFATLFLGVLFSVEATILAEKSKEIIFLTGSHVMSFSEQEMIYTPPAREDENTVYMIVDEYPRFQYSQGMRHFVDQNIIYPEKAISKHIEGVVLVNFVIERDGSISSPRIIRGIGGGCDEEVLRVVQLFPPARPGKIAGNPVRVSFTLPIRFELK